MLERFFSLETSSIGKTLGTSRKKKVNAYEDFFQQIVESHVLAAAMEYLGMESVEDQLNADIFPPTLWMLDREERYEILLSVCGAIVEDFTDIRTFETDQEESGGRRNSQDKVLAYAKEVMSFGLLYMELVDAVREGDGLRILRWWRFMLLIFKATGRKNYCIEAFILLAQYQYLLSPQEKTQLLYSRFINTHGRPGKNISCDLYMEHLNRLLKDAIKALGANKTTKAIDRVGKCIAPLDELLDRFDTAYDYSSQSDHHKIPKANKDITIMLEQLHKADVFRCIPGRKHRAFSKFRNNPVLALTQEDVNVWMKSQWTKLLAGLL